MTTKTIGGWRVSALERMRRLLWMGETPPAPPTPTRTEETDANATLASEELASEELARKELAGKELTGNALAKEPPAMTSTPQTDPTQVDNGVNIQAVLDARTAIEATPEAGRFTWRARCAWVEGVHSRTTVDGFFGLGEEQNRKAAHTIDADHPEHFAAMDMGATPVELVLSALASCLTAGVASVAQNRGVQLRSVQATVEGDMDLAGILGIDGDVRNGFSAIRVTFSIDADASRDDVAAIVAQSQKRSAVFDIITNPTNVHVSVA